MGRGWLGGGSDGTEKSKRNVQRGLAEEERGGRKTQRVNESQLRFEESGTEL